MSSERRQRKPEELELIKEALHPYHGIYAKPGHEVGIARLGCHTLTSQSASDEELVRRIVEKLDCTGIHVRAKDGTVQVFRHFRYQKVTIEEVTAWVPELELIRDAVNAAIDWRVCQEVEAGLAAIGLVTSPEAAPIPDGVMGLQRIGGGPDLGD